MSGEGTSREIAEKWAQRGRAVRQKVDQISARAWSRNGELGVTVDAQGRVVDVRLSPQALGLGEVRLAQMLIDTLQKAQSDAARQLQDAWQPLTADPAVREILDFGQQLIQPHQEPALSADTSNLSDDEQARLHEQWISRQFRSR